MLLLPALGAATAGNRYFDSNGVRIRYVEEGSGEPVVLIHGFTGSIERSWIETGVLQDLARDYRVIALDLRGHGRSGKPHDPAAYREIGEDAIRLLDHLDIARAHVVGHSLGGIIVAKLLTTHPQRFLSATLAGAAHRRGTGPQSDAGAEAAARELESGAPYRTLILSTAPTDAPPPGEEAIRGISARIVALNDPLAHAALMRARRALLVADADIRAVRVPALAILGSADPALPRVKRLHAAWPALELVVIEGATHPAAHPRSVVRRPEFLAAIREFLRTHRESLKP
jgi:pimeloyl-ACP methyl ester carboxylesterase